MIKLSCQGAFLTAKMRAFMQKLKFLMQRCKLSYKNVRFNIKINLQCKYAIFDAKSANFNINM